MTIYEMTIDYINGRWIGPVDSSDWAKIVTVPIQGRIVDWAPVPFEWTPGGDGVDENDFVYCQGFVIGLSPLAQADVARLVGDDGQWLPVTDSEYVLFRKLKYFDCLDRENSKTISYDGDVSEIIKPVLKGTRIGDANIFGVPQKPFHNFVSEKLAEIISSSHLTGVTFSPVAIS
jgi:hypothetical protein